MSQDGIVADPMLDCETTRYLLPQQKADSAVLQAFWELAPAPTGSDQSDMSQNEYQHWTTDYWHWFI